MASPANFGNEVSGDSFFVLPTKNKKRTNFEKCLLCQKDSNEKLRNAQEASIKNLIDALEIRKDDNYERLKPDFQSLKQNDIVWHPNCYKTCTSKHNLKIIENRSGSPVDIESSNTGRRSRSNFGPVDWSNVSSAKIEHARK